MSFPLNQSAGGHCGLMLAVDLTEIFIILELAFFAWFRIRVLEKKVECSQER